MSHFGAVQYARARDGASIAYQVKEGVGPTFLRISTPGAPPGPVRPRIDIYAEGTPQFAGERPLVIFDWRGSGYSAEAGPPRSLHDLVLDVEAVTQAIDRPVDAVSFGLACFTACTFASEYPRAWRSLVLSDASVRFESNAQSMIDSIVDQPDWNAKYVEHLLLIASRHWKPAPGNNMVEIVHTWAREVPPAIFAAYHRIHKQGDITEILPKIDIPVLVTNALGAAADATVAARLPNGRLLQRDPIFQRSDHRAWSRDDWDAHLGVLFEDAQPAGHAATSNANAVNADGGYNSAHLSDRELEVLRLVARGLRNQEIADELGISRATVTRHISNILDKTGARGRLEAANYAMHHRLLD